MEARLPQLAAVPLERRWYAPLALPVEGTVTAALERVRTLEPDTELWWCPRTGLASAWLANLVHTFGTRRGRRLVQGGAVLGELYNLRQFTGAPEPEQQRRWARQQSRAVRRLVHSVLAEEQAQARAVLALWRARPLTAPQPESVLWLRALTGWAALAGGIDVAEHQLLDDVAAATGRVLECRLGKGPPAHAQLQQALQPLADSVFAERLEASLARPGGVAIARQVPCWRPLAPPVVALGVSGDLLGEHHDAVEQALQRVVADGVYADTGRWLLQRGGKRVRPALTLAAAQACGGDPAAAVTAAALVEWLHQASLLLDDVMDRAELRRGAPTLHTATSVPDALAVFCWLLERVEAAASALPAPMRDALRDGARQLALGQLEEVAQTGEIGLTLAGYHRILAGKTASLFGVAARLGALGAGANRRQVRAAEEVARCAGLAFQLMDDLLDYTGETAAFGKACGVDLRAQKVTLPIMRLRAKLARGDRERLDALLARGTAEPVDVRWVRSQLVRHGVEGEVRERAHAHLSRAEAALARLPGDSTWLRALTLRCVERSR